MCLRVALNLLVLKILEFILDILFIRYYIFIYICTYRGKSECCLFFSFHYSPLSELHLPSERCNPLPIFSVVSLSVVSFCDTESSVSPHQHCQPSLR